MKIKSLRQISFMIAWSGMINLALSMVVSVIFKALYNLNLVGAEFETASLVVMLYAAWILLVTTMAANKIDKVVDERREAIRRKRKIIQLTK